MITGAAQGFGRTLTNAFAERGAKLALLDSATLVSTRTTFRFNDDLEDVWGEISASVKFFNVTQTTALFAKVDVNLGDDVSCAYGATTIVLFIGGSAICETAPSNNSTISAVGAGLFFGTPMTNCVVRSEDSPSPAM